MIRNKLILLLLILVIGMSACSENALKNNTYYQLVLSIERSINKGSWEIAGKQVESLKIYYDQNYHLMKKIGENNEYLDVKEGIEGLQLAIKEKNKDFAIKYATKIKRTIESLFKE